MIKSKLSDLEWEEILSYAVDKELPAMRQYLDRLLYYRSLGTDGCSRPLAFREKRKLDPPCFAVGYIENLESFVEETYKREPKKLMENMKAYCSKLKEEINSFFKK
jgi:hypothetical protein